MSAEDTLKLRFPDFLCIGAQKAGTTWLDANLRRHPSVWMPWIKELQYFNDVYLPAHRAWTGAHRQKHAEAAVRRLVKHAEGKQLDLRTLHRITGLVAEPLSDMWYGSVFAHAADNQICGEVTPEYSLLPREGIEHVRRLNPSMKIIFLMRDPIERCWSHLRMLRNARPGIDLIEASESVDVLSRADYPSILRRWRAIFDEEHFFTAWSEDVASEPVRFLERAMAFLGQPMHPAVSRRAAEAVFVGPEQPMPEPIAQRLRERLAGVYSSLRAEGLLAGSTPA